MGNLILGYQRFEQITGNIIKNIFLGSVDNPNKRHPSSPKNLIKGMIKSRFTLPMSYPKKKAIPLSSIHCLRFNLGAKQENSSKYLILIRLYVFQLL